MVYKCLDGGASSSSSMSVTCQANGQWSDPPEACVFRSCGHPPAVLHALPKLLKRPTGNTFPATSVIQLSLAVGGIIQYPCKPGERSPLSLLLFPMMSYGFPMSKAVDLKKMFIFC